MTASAPFQPSSRPRRAVGDGVALVLLAVVAAAVLVTAMRSPLKDDVAWLLYVARKWLEGQRLYEDLVEVNPPLIIWIYAVPAWLAKTFDVAPKLIAVPYFALFLVGTAAWSARLLQGRWR